MADKVTKTDLEWREQLSELAYKVTRKKGTERAFSHDNFPKQNGTFSCVCCNAPLFNADAKFDSGTGWPSFFQPITDTAVEERSDNGFFMRRTEILCANCDAHLGHVLPDGPNRTGQRYCMNGVAMTFAKSDKA